MPNDNENLEREAQFFANANRAAFLTLLISRAEKPFTARDCSSIPGSENRTRVLKSGPELWTLFTRPSEAVRTAFLQHSESRKSGAESAYAIHMFDVAAGASAAQKLLKIHFDLCAALARLARPGQILLTRAAFDSARPLLRGKELGSLGNLSWLNHGKYFLEGGAEWLEICQVE